MQLVANLGFPAIVTMYLLVRIEGKLESLSIGINSLNSNISELNNKIYKATHPNINQVCSFFVLSTFFMPIYNSSYVTFRHIVFSC